MGQAYSYTLDITDVSRAARGRAGNSTTVRNGNLKHDVEILIDIQKADWIFLTQPGAIRRVVMNLIGNSIKYCPRGQIIVSLELESDATTSADRVMVLTVADTGCGMSPEFLSSRLFLPFAQENSLAPGTGLGKI